MVTRRVYIVWSHPLFRDSVRLLLGHPAIELVGTSSDQEQALAEMGELQPGTIIVEEVEDETANVIQPLQILKACPWEPRVIRMSLQDNELWVYHHQRRSIDSSEEFLRIVQDD